MNSSLRPPLIVILGPTAVGKTEISIELARRLHGEIVSADSRLLYRGMDIGTAKPTRDELEKVPHYLVDVANPDEPWSVAVFQREARKAIAGIHDRGLLPFLVGGTGQYIRAVIEEWDIPKAKPHPEIRQALENWSHHIGLEGLHERLETLDPHAASSIDPRNMRRTIRALEVIFLTGQRFSDQKQQGESPYHTLQIGLLRPREELYARVDERIDTMLRAGLVEEVRMLLGEGYSPDLPTLSAIGYREIIGYLQGQIEYTEAVRLIKRATRIFVRRQANWFKASAPDIHWFDLSIYGIDEIEKLIRVWL